MENGVLQVNVGPSWRGMVAGLADGIRAALRSPFDTGLVLVDSPGSARLLSQEVAAIDGISAGVEYLTVAAFARRLAEASDVAADHAAWRSSRLVTTIWAHLDDVAAEHPLLRRFVSRPGRKLSAAARFARLLRSYAEHAPALVEAWSDGEDGDLPEHLAWQPELFRRACESLGVDVVDLQATLHQVAASLDTPTWVFAVDDVPAALVSLVEAAQPVAGWFVDAVPDWVEQLRHTDPVVDDRPRPAPVVELHGSHSRLRQVEVLRDTLTRLFEEDPTLEPRDVRIVCPRPEVWGPTINAVFQSGSHPGRSLRVAEVAPPTGGNLAVDALVACLELLDDRATATQVVEFLLLPALAHRWGFAQSREDLVELVADAQIRWGLDSTHRRRYGLPNTDFNTWFKGIDALLTGIAMGGEVGPPGVAGVDRTTSSDLALIGSLSEVISRLRAFAGETAGELTVPQWCAAATTALERLVGLGYEESWMQRQAETILERLARAHAGSDARFTRREFRRLLTADLPSRWHRPGLGNGALHVVPPSEARHVDARVVAFLGIDDSHHRAIPDQIPGTIPDGRARRLEHLLAQARSADRVAIIASTRSERTGQELQPPTAIAWLLLQLGVDPVRTQHAPQPFNPSQFARAGSFDEPAFLGARQSGSRLPAPVLERRRTAMGLPLGPRPERVTLDELRQFLQDPLRTFLRNTVDIRWFDDTELDDAVPLEVNSLAKWGVSDAFVTGQLAGVAPPVLARRQRARQVFPPGRLGEGSIARIGVESERIVHLATRLMSEARREEPIDIDVDGIRFTGSVPLHGDVLVRPTATSTHRAFTMPWLELLALSVAGVQARASIVRPGRGGARVTTLGQPAPAVAAGVLGLYLDALHRGTHRLFPVPWDAAYPLSTEISQDRFDRGAWLNPPPFSFPKWRPKPWWGLFFDDPVTGLMDEPATDLDPPGAGPSMFERWAVALYGPLNEAGGGW